MKVRDNKTLWLTPNTWKKLAILKAKKGFKTFELLILDMLKEYNGDKE